MFKNQYEQEKLMANEVIKDLVSQKFRLAGIDINQNNRSGIQVHDQRFYETVWNEGSLGLGESYMNGWWDAERVDEFIYHILKADLESTIKPNFKQLFQLSKYLLFNLQSKKRALIVGKKHYDIGNDLFIKMLDKRMAYSCAYWKNASNLDEAQEAKLELICQKLYLKPGMRILDIGCGWGSFAKYAAEKHHVEVVGITISQQQLELAKELCKELPVTLRFQDYRDVNDMFDRIVSIGQMEHVGYKNYRTYMQTAYRCLKNDGIFLLHTIGSNKTTKKSDPWIEKYIFPNGMVPSAEQLTQAANGLFIFEDWHNFGAYYDKTLMAWHDNFVRNWDSLKAHYDERFYRMWTYYLLSCAGAFRSRDLQLWQIVFVKKGIPGGYISVR
ncbi:cyclopropane fatty acyl phospholipid synthase [Candidatus Protochlamydia phocaeensis]|uniref:cyclopropane fatty acyl phospholipid synthase n=1 Tax=Candidatus Protochlamydia phocaeensis TaxID=1414722 RepID=UPI003B968603